MKDIKVMKKTIATEPNKQCLQIVNNMSGRNFKVKIAKKTFDRQFHLFSLAHTIDWSNRNLPQSKLSPCLIEVNPDKNDKGPNSQPGDIEFVLFSGRGFGLQVFNYGKDSSNFEILMDPLDKDKKVELTEAYPIGY